MDLNIENDISGIIEKQLHKELRYKCLLIQSNDISIFSDICRCASKAATQIGCDSIALDANMMQDDIGAHSCSQIVDYISKASLDKILILSGPLHFLDYWTRQQCGFFWGHFACLENSMGIIMIDIIRTEDIQGVFTVIDRTPNVGIRYLKSRRALLEANIK